MLGQTWRRLEKANFWKANMKMDVHAKVELNPQHRSGNTVLVTVYGTGHVEWPCVCVCASLRTFRCKSSVALYPESLQLNAIPDKLSGLLTQFRAAHGLSTWSKHSHRIRAQSARPGGNVIRSFLAFAFGFFHHFHSEKFLLNFLQGILTRLTRLQRVCNSQLTVFFVCSWKI